MTVTYPFQPFRLLENSIDFFSQKVIAQRKGNEHYNVYMKGAPEIIAKLCDPVTGSTLIHKMSWTYFVNKLVILCTVPSNYYEVLKHYTTQGYRVIALAAKTMNPQITGECHMRWNSNWN